LKDEIAAIEYLEGRRMLFDNSYRAIPFNIIMALVLCISLYYNGLPHELILTWLSLVVIVSSVRMFHCKKVVKKKLYNNSSNLHFKLFLALTALIWASIYFISIDHTDTLQLYLILLVCGGMAAGSTASLGVYLPSFFIYVLSIFLPIIIYNYALLNVNSAIFATLFVWFLVAITIIAKSHQNLFQHVFFLTEQNKVLMDKFEILSITDSLTGLYNRRYFTKMFQEELNRSKRNQQSFSLLSIDVDNFKLINDNLGHPFGDAFLTYMAEYLKSKFQRANDIIFRIGGDEFAVLILNTTQEKTKLICSKIQSDFLKIPRFNYAPQDPEHQSILEQVSLSMGVVYVPHDSNTKIEQIIEKVDQSLYQAKHEGKNRIKLTSISRLPKV